MSNVSDIRERFEFIERARNTGGNGNGGGGDVEDRVRKLENNFVRLEAVLPTLATSTDLSKLRSDMHEAFHAQTWKIITFVATISTALVAATYFIARFTH